MMRSTAAKTAAQLTLGGPPRLGKTARSVSSRTSGVEAQRRRQRVESVVVRAASLAGSREMMLESSAFGNRLMRSSRPAAPPKRVPLTAEKGGSGRHVRRANIISSANTRSTPAPEEERRLGLRGGAPGITDGGGMEEEAAAEVQSAVGFACRICNFFLLK
jgi:hypothetical protein